MITLELEYFLILSRISLNLHLLLEVEYLIVKTSTELDMSSFRIKTAQLLVIDIEYSHILLHRLLHHFHFLLNHY